MIRSLYSGVSGMRTHQLRMDVIGNNIANVNTTAYKAARVTFQDMLSQTLRGAANPEAGIGGINIVQVGLGVAVGSIDTLFTQGGLMSTGRSLDVAIHGNGFFVVENDTGPNPQYLYTRDGTFYIDKDGYLVNSSNYKVLGADGNYIQLANSGNALATIYIARDGSVTAYDSAGNSLLPPNTKIGLYGFKNPESLEKLGYNLYRPAQNTVGFDSNLPISPTTKPTLQAPGTSGMGTLEPASLEMSNVDLTMEFANMIVTQRGYQANARVITTSDQMLEELINLKR